MSASVFTEPLMWDTHGKNEMVEAFLSLEEQVEWLTCLLANKYSPCVTKFGLRLHFIITDNVAAWQPVTIGSYQFLAKGCALLKAMKLAQVSLQQLWYIKFPQWSRLRHNLKEAELCWWCSNLPSWTLQEKGYFSLVRTPQEATETALGEGFAGPGSLPKIPSFRSLASGMQW